MLLAGELQPGSFFLPFSLLLIFKEGLLWQKIAIQILAGLATYALLRELKLTRLAAMAGGALFALNGTMAWTPGPAAVYCSAPFLPMLIWGIERSRKVRQGAISILAVGAAIAWSVLAGFPEPAYISGLLALAWGVYRLVYTMERSAMLRRTLTGLLLGLLVAAPLLIAFVDYIQSSDSFAVHKLSGLALPWSALPLTLMPYTFGPLAFGATSKLLATIWGNVGGYTTALAFAVALFAFGGSSREPARDRGLKILLLSWVAITWLRGYGVQPITAVINRLPLLSHATFCRFSAPSWEFAIAVLAAYGLDTLRDAAFSRRAFWITLGLLAISLGFAWPRRAAWGWSRGQELLMFGLLVAALAWALGSLLLLWYLLTRFSGERRRRLVVCLLLIDAAGAFLVPEACARRSNHLDIAAVTFLREHQGLSRVHSLGPLRPNYGAYFQIASIDHNVLPVPRLWASYVDSHLMPGLLKDSDGVIFETGVGSHGSDEGQQTLLQHLAEYENVGVRYVLTNPGQSPLPGSTAEGAVAAPPKQSRLVHWSMTVLGSDRSSKLQRWVADKIVRILGAHGGATAIPGTVSVGSAGASANPDPAALGLTKVYSDVEMDIWELPHPAPYYQVSGGGPCELVAEERDRVRLHCRAPAVLRRRELYMPGWQVTEDGQAHAAVRQDGIFQAVDVPAGDSALMYAFTPPHTDFGVLACLLGLAGLLVQVVRLAVAGRKPLAAERQTSPVATQPHML